MNSLLRNDAELIARGAIAAVIPEEAVRRALQGKCFSGAIYLVAVGKAAWKMAEATSVYLNQPIKRGIVITKYAHVESPLPGITCYEAGHPIPDDNTYNATQAVLDMTKDLNPEDTVLFMLSGGGSSLFEKPLLSDEELRRITEFLLGCGADITEINTIRKRLSAVKGGRFAQWCAPAHVHAIVLSDVLGDRLDMIASGPTVPDNSTCLDAIRIVEKYNLPISFKAWQLLHCETPKILKNSTSQIIGNVSQLCAAAEEIALSLGYEPILLTDHLNGEAQKAGRFLGDVLRLHATDGKKLAFLAGGETVVHLTGVGKGGRNQEIALSAAETISSIPNVCVISVGSDGTDGPTDAAGGYSDGDTKQELLKRNITISDILFENNSYYALKAVDGLIITGPTGTNVNDISVGLVG